MVLVLHVILLHLKMEQLRQVFQLEHLLAEELVLHQVLRYLQRRMTLTLFLSSYITQVEQILTSRVIRYTLRRMVDLTKAT